MSIEFKKLTQITLSGVGGIPINALRVVLDGESSDVSLLEMESLFSQIREAATGAICSCAFFIGDPADFNPGFATLGNNTITIGGSTGIKYSFRAVNDPRYQECLSVGVFAENNYIGGCTVYGGRITYEIAFPIIFTTADYKLISFTNQLNNNNMINLRSDSLFFEIKMANDIPYAVVPEDGEFDSNVMADHVTFTSRDVHGYITAEQKPDPYPDPYAPGGSSGPGGGNGSFDRSGDTIPFPSKPAISATDCGFLTLFATNQAGIKSLANYLWSDLFSAIQPGGTLEETITTLKKVVSNPYDAILGCSIVPVTPPTGGNRDIKLYGVLDSGVQLPVVTEQWVEKDCGTLNIAEYWGSYLDYAPYTKVTSLYLPYIGVVSIDTDIIMGKNLQVKYWIDVLSGQCVACILVNGSLEFQYQGHCSTPIPVTSIDFSSTIQSGLSLVGSIANVAGTAVGALGMGAGAGLAKVGRAAMTQLPSVASDVMNSKPDIKSGSGVGGSGGLMSCQTPYLILEWPRQSLPSIVDSDDDVLTQKHWTGYPSNMGVNLGRVKGYVEVTRVNVNRMTATEEEKLEIEELLSGGVYF